MLKGVFTGYNCDFVLNSAGMLSVLEGKYMKRTRSISLDLRSDGIACNLADSRNALECACVRNAFH